MKIPARNQKKDKKIVKKLKVKPKKENVLIVAQEIKFARLLASNEKKTRDRALKTLKKWLLNCFQKNYVFKEEDFARIWKGLFYAVWMSDKPLVQEDLCENISSILDEFPEDHLQSALLLFRVGMKQLATEWYGIDQHRMDKCLMLVRRYLRGSLRCLRRCSWRLDACRLYSEALAGPDGILARSTPLYARNASSMLLHVADCFLEELSKVSEGAVPEESVCELLRPFCVYMCAGSSPALCAASRRLLTALVRQSELGQRYNHATRAWCQMGCPRGGPESLELVEEADSDSEHSEDSDREGAPAALDPRAGRVDVWLHPLPVPSTQLAAVLRALIATTSSKAHRRAKICLQRFEQLARDQYPLVVEQPALDEHAATPTPTQAARSLRTLEKTLAAESDELALRGLSRKHRKRLLAKTRAGLSIVEEVAGPARGVVPSGDWQVEETQPTTQDSNKQTAANKENVIRNKAKKRKADRAQAQAQPLKKIKLNGTENDNKKQKTNNNKIKNTDKTVKQRLTNGINNAPKLIKESNKSTKLIPETTAKKYKKPNKNEKVIAKKTTGEPSLVVNKVKNIKKQPNKMNKEKKLFENKCSSPKKVQFVLKNNCMQGAVDYYKSVRQSPNIPFDSAKMPSKTNLKPSTPSPINPFFKKKLRLSKL